MDDKDQIKNMLETHKKQYSLSTLIIGVIVALLVGAAVGYGVKSLIKSGKNVSNQAMTEENYSTPSLNEEDNAMQNKQPTEAENNTEDYTVGGNNTQPPNTANSSLNTQDNNSVANNESGPEIISPKINKSSSRKTEIERVNKTHTKKILVKHSKVRHPLYRHRATKRKFNLTKYVIQVSSNLNNKVALSTLIKLRKYGFKAYIVCVNIHNKEYTRIMVGPIMGYRAAIFQSSKIKKKLRLAYSPLIKKYD